MTESQRHTLIFTAGGTGGHIYPAIAIASAFREALPACRIVFVGEEGSLEAAAAAEEGFDFHRITSYPLPYGRVHHYVAWFFKNLRGTISSVAYLRKERPAFVFGTGGYVTAPLIAAARLCRVPYFLHEQNAVPGRANRFFAKGARCVFIAYERSRQYFKKGVTLAFSGNPVRSSFQTLEKESSRARLGIDRDTFLILMAGGSMGSETVNKAVEGLGNGAGHAWQRFLDRHPEVHVVLSTGKMRDRAKSDAMNNIPHVRAYHYIDDLPTWLSAADLFVGRAGAMTLAEVAYAGKPSILVPFPFAVDNHQRENARVMEEGGASVVFEDRVFTSDVLLKALEALLDDRPALDRMARSASALAVKDAPERIVETTCQMTGGLCR